MTLKEFLENYYYGKNVRIYVDCRAIATGATSQVLEHIKKEQLDKPIKMVAPVNYEMVDIAI